MSTVAILKFVSVRQCKSVFEFTATDPAEMSFKEGKIINVLKSTETGWWKGKIEQTEGWFPSSYVMVLYRRFMIALLLKCSTISRNIYIRYRYH